MRQDGKYIYFEEEEALVDSFQGLDEIGFSNEIRAGSIQLARYRF
jgi:hypothetical protein